MVIYPCHTRDTVVRVHSVPWCAEIHYRTRTRTTRFGKPAGFPVPVPNPTEVWARPGKTGVIGLLLCLYWQAEYSGAGNDWNDNIKCINSIFDAIPAIPEL